MKYFVASMLFIFLVTGYFWIRTDFTTLEEEAAHEGLPALNTENPGGAEDPELQALLEEAKSAGDGAGAQAVEVAAAEPTAAIGEELYNQSGANSCLYCHGAGGLGGNVATAAKLNDPSKWKIAKILGSSDLGNDKFEEATVALIWKGAIVHNSSFKKDWFKLAKAGSPYDSQMLGIVGAPSAKWIKQNKDKGITPEVAAKSLYLYLKTL